jgi:acetyl-CoA carboxylase biotin carboxylase subunit
VPAIAKLLIANRGEIARRIARTARSMGLATVAVYSEADLDAPHVREADEAVRIGPPPSRESYLSIDRILAAAKAVGADAVHPGYGFLSENADLASRCAEAGLVFVGPSPEAIRRMGSKIEAKALMAAAGVPIVPGGTGGTDVELAAEARRIGFPVLIKASAGGGGKGMRVVRDAAGVDAALAAARREAASAFGDDTLLLERYLEAPRHIEVQIVGDASGRVVHCFERECSIQRRYQKIVEEAPSLAVDQRLRTRLGKAAVAAARAIDYVGAGTVEFLVDRRGAFYFLEMNTRLQVEHPVTEMVTGLDLVRLQLLVAQGEALPFRQEDLSLDGHAVEARLCAEDPARDFLPATGRVVLWDPAELPGVRYDSGIAAGTEVGVHYDPLLAKVIAHGPSRGEAVRRLVRALRLLGVAGVATNRDFLVDVLTHPAFAAGEIDTHFIDEHFPAERRQRVRDAARDRVHAVVAALDAHERQRARGPLPPSIPSGWRNNRWRAQDVSYRVAEDEIEVRYVALGGGRFDVEAGGSASTAVVVSWDEGRVDLELDGVRRRFSVLGDVEAPIVHGPLGTVAVARVPRFPPPKGERMAGGCLAPMTGVIRDIRVTVGSRVEPGTVLLVLEAMKMEHEMIARAPGVVKEIRVEVGQMVDPDAVLIVVEPVEE